MHRIATATPISFFILELLYVNNLYYISDIQTAKLKSNTGNKYTCVEAGGVPK